MGVLISENVMKLRLSTKGVLLKCFFLHLAIFWLETPDQKHKYAHFLSKSYKMHLVQKN